VADLAGLAVHRLLRADDLGAERVRDALVAQADAEDRDAAGEAADDAVGDARLARRAGPGEMTIRSGRAGLDLLGRDGVVADRVDLRAEEPRAWTRL
jgi:hypothetical protein